MRLEAGQEGEDFSSLPVFEEAAANAPSGQEPRPASLPVSPGGRVRLTEENSWEPSLRRRLTTIGVLAPAIGETEPASRSGVLGRAPWEAGQTPPSGAWLIAQVSEGVSGGPDSGADQGVRLEVAWYWPQTAGVRSGPPAPPKKCSLKSSKGSWGLCRTVLVSWPVLGSAWTSPASFTTVPVAGSSRVM